MHALPSDLGLDAIHPETRGEWRLWLSTHQDRTDGVWIARYKRSAGRAGPSLRDLVEEALCAGWIDSLPRKLDADRTLLYVSPRKPGSHWSALNKRYVAALESAGQMRPPGTLSVAEAKADGSWDALGEVDALVVPGDLAATFETLPGSRERWDAFPPSVRRGILEWILTAKRPETRRRRVLETAEKAARGERANQWSPHA